MFSTADFRTKNIKRTAFDEFICSWNENQEDYDFLYKTFLLCGHHQSIEPYNVKLLSKAKREQVTVKRVSLIIISFLIYFHFIGQFFITKTMVIVWGPSTRITGTNAVYQYQQKYIHYPLCSGNIFRGLRILGYHPMLKITIFFPKFETLIRKKSLSFLCCRSTLCFISTQSKFMA